MRVSTESVPATSCRSRCARCCRWVFGTAIVLAVLGALYLMARFLPDRPVVYADITEHFKYGSNGGERESGFPLEVWKVMPKICAEYLPGEGYQSLGMNFEKGRDLPVGVSQRRHLGIDRVFLNCAACHTSTVRDAPDAEPRLYLGTPAQQFNLNAFQDFMFNCVSGGRFDTARIIAEIDAANDGLSLLDRKLVYPVALALMRERVLMLRGRFTRLTDRQPEWGPGRVDTFGAAKMLVNFPMDQLPQEEIQGYSDFPSIWLQEPRKKRDDGQRMQLHWDGNNDSTEERNKSAAFGTGTTPPTIDLKAIARIEDWLLKLEPPTYPYPIDKALAAQGQSVYAEYCAGCHGASGRDFSGAKVGHVTPIAEIGTDRGRLDSYTYELAVNQAGLYAGYPHRFRSFRKTHGYANMPLDGLWLRAPYLHNGSVPNLCALLEPAEKRPQSFYRGNDVYDPVRLGFVSDVAAEGARRYFLYDTQLPGNSRAGHEGRAYGTELPEADKRALVEFLKTF